MMFPKMRPIVLARIILPSEHSLSILIISIGPLLPSNSTPGRELFDRTWLIYQLIREGLIGKYDYAFLFKPNIPFIKKSPRTAPFFGLNDRMPYVLAEFPARIHGTDTT